MDGERIKCKVSQSGMHEPFLGLNQLPLRRKYRPLPVEIGIIAFSDQWANMTPS